MSGDAHVRFWESAGVQLPRATHLPSAKVQTKREIANERANAFR